MCHESCLAFGQRVVGRDQVIGLDVLEVGAHDINGSLRQYIESLGPRSYVGVDIASGKGVDVVCPASALVETFGQQCQDVVICTEMLEHAEDWHTVVWNLKEVLRDNGLLVLTTRSYGYPLHGYPYDFWRFEVEDLAIAFRDFDLIALERDPWAPGVFLAGRRRGGGTVSSLDSLAVHSMVLGRRAVRLNVIQSLCVRLSARFSHRAPLVLRRLLRKLVFGRGKAEHSG